MSLHTIALEYNSRANHRKELTVFKVVYLCTMIMTYGHGEMPGVCTIMKDEVSCLIAGANLHPEFVTSFSCMPGEALSPWLGFVEKSPLPPARVVSTVVE
jgi:hypothetical protein